MKTLDSIERLRIAREVLEEHSESSELSHDESIAISIVLNDILPEV